MIRSKDVAQWFGVYYSLPSSDHQQEALLLCADLSSFSNTILVGDFNIERYQEADPCSQELVALTTGFMLSQVVALLTCFFAISSATLTDPAYVASLNSGCCPSGLFLIINTSCSQCQLLIFIGWLPTLRVYPTSLSDFLRVDDVNSMWLDLKLKAYQAAHESIPSKVVSCR